MAVWVVRGAKGGVHEQRMLDKDFASIGFETIPDMSKIKSQEEMQDLWGYGVKSRIVNRKWSPGIEVSFRACGNGVKRLQIF